VANEATWGAYWALYRSSRLVNLGALTLLADHLLLLALVARDVRSRGWQHGWVGGGLGRSCCCWASRADCWLALLAPAAQQRAAPAATIIHPAWLIHHNPNAPAAGCTWCQRWW
jgi:hypothetical protein